MKRISIVLIIMLLLAGAALKANAEPMLSLGSTTVETGNTASLELSISDHTGKDAGINKSLAQISLNPPRYFLILHG